MHIKQIAKKYLPKRLAEPLRKVWHDINYASGRYDVVSVPAHCIEKGMECRMIDTDRKTIAIAPHFYGQPAPVLQDQIAMPDTYLAIVEKAKVIGSSNVILVEKEALYNAPIGKNYFYSDNAFFLETEPSSLSQIGPARTVFWKRGRSRKFEKAISLLCNFSFNYYHYVLECIPKLFLIEKCDIPIDIPLLIDSCVGNTPQFLAYLDVFLKRTGRSIIWVRPRERLFIGRLFLPSPVNIVPPNLVDLSLCAPRDTLFDMEYVRKTRERMLKSVSCSSMPESRRIFISRKNQARRAYNEKEVWKIAQKYGFSVVSPETMTIAEQIQTFFSADWIIAASGAALTNIIYCHPGCQVLVLANLNIELSIFSSIAKAIGIKMMYIAGDCMVRNIQAGFSIAPQEVENYLLEMS